jgi:hypothetical protein
MLHAGRLGHRWWPERASSTTACAPCAHGQQWRYACHCIMPHGGSGCIRFLFVAEMWVYLPTGAPIQSAVPLSLTTCLGTCFCRWAPQRRRSSESRTARCGLPLPYTSLYESLVSDAEALQQPPRGQHRLCARPHIVSSSVRACTAECNTYAAARAARPLWAHDLTHHTCT